MEFFPIKCEVLSVIRKHNQVAYSYSLHNDTLRRVSSTKYLGVTISSDLNWNRHFLNITGRANQALGFAKRNFRSMACKALVRPHLEYCASVWDPHTQCAVQRLEIVQWRAARYVMRRYQNTSSVTHMLDYLQWPLLSQRRSCLRLVFLYKTVNQLVAIPPDLYISSHQTNTRTHQHAFLPFLCSTNSYRHSFFPSNSMSMEYSAWPYSCIIIPQEILYIDQVYKTGLYTCISQSVTKSVTKSST